MRLSAAVESADPHSRLLRLAEIRQEAVEYPLKATRAPGLRDSALLALYLASDDSAFVSGQTIAIDAALLARMADPFKPEYRERQRQRREAADAAAG